MSQIPGDVEVKEGTRLMITAWDYRGRCEVVRGPYIVKNDFHVWRRFQHYVDWAGIKYPVSDKDPFPIPPNVQLSGLMQIYYQPFIQWLIDQLYLDVEPKHVLHLGSRILLNHREDGML